jgi:hypothetical protein
VHLDRRADRLRARVETERHGAVVVRVLEIVGHLATPGDEEARAVAGDGRLIAAVERDDVIGRRGGGARRLVQPCEEARRHGVAVRPDDQHPSARADRDADPDDVMVTRQQVRRHGRRIHLEHGTEGRSRLEAPAIHAGGVAVLARLVPDDRRDAGGVDRDGRDGDPEPRQRPLADLDRRGVRGAGQDEKEGEEPERIAHGRVVRPEAPRRQRRSQSRYCGFRRSRKAAFAERCHSTSSAITVASSSSTGSGTRIVISPSGS